MHREEIQNTGGGMKVGRNVGKREMSTINLKTEKERSKKSRGDSNMFFENLPDLLRPATAASLLGLSVETIYDWRYRQQQRNVPDALFLKLNRILYVRTAILKEWISSQN